MRISKTNFVCYATNLGIFLAMSFRLALLLSLLSNSTLMTNYGKCHVIELLLDLNPLQIKLTLYVNSPSLKSRGSSKKAIIRRHLRSPHAHTLHSYFSAEYINTFVRLLGLNELLLIFNRPWQLLYSLD
jgi:hypothetical protein